MQPTPDCFAAPKVRLTLVQVKRFVLFAAVAAAIVLPTWSEVAAQTRNPLFEQTTSPAVISQQVRFALPSAERGLQLLTSGGGPEQLALAVQSLDDTYKYLRAAQESTNLLVGRAKFPDPMAQMEMKQMWEIRKHMMFCTGQAGHIVNQNQEVIEQCAGRVTEGIRQLRVLLAIMP
jgi:hypothetical protein